MARSANDANSLSFALNGIAEVQREAGDLADAEANYEQAIALARALGDSRGSSVMLSNLACVLITSGRLDRARAALTECMALARVLGSKGTVECVRGVVVALAAASASHSTAARLHGAVLARMRDSGSRHEPVDEAFIAGWIARTRTAMGTEAFDVAETEGTMLSYEAAIAEMNRWLERPA